MTVLGGPNPTPLALGGDQQATRQTAGEILSADLRLHACEQTSALSVARQQSVRPGSW